MSDLPPHPDSQHSPPRCPYLGVDVRNGRLGEAIEYPSFENRCWTTTRPIPLLLTDQATHCLCNGYLHCPRFLAARAARQGQEGAAAAAPADSDSITSALKELEADVQAAATSQAKSRRRWGWIGAGLIFLSSLLCGGFFAAYVGWQMVRDEIAYAVPGQIDTLASPAKAQSAAQPQTYIIVTATSLPVAGQVAQAPNQLAAPPANSANGSQPVYPVAVAPTPAPASNQSQQAPPSIADIAQSANAASTVGDNTAQATPILDFQLQVPTRRPTPLLDNGVPTSTPITNDTPTPQPTATLPPPLGTPVVVFYAEDKQLVPGECTTVYWNVQNVQAVYYENIGVNGQGNHEECIHDHYDGNYTLMTILPSGLTDFYTVTVHSIPATDTPAPTPTRTEVPEPTATWTPNVPTDTPTPSPIYGAVLEANSDTNISCGRGATCQLDFYAENGGDTVDDITVLFTEAASWPHQLCRLDGICSNSKMTLANMGPTSTGVVRLSVTIPKDASSETMTYKVQAISEKSGGGAVSKAITVKVTVDESK